jgi:hypothetical protein
MQINPNYQSVLQKDKKAHIAKEIYGPRQIRRGLLRTALNKMLRNLTKRVKRLIFRFFALRAKNNETSPG